MPKPKFRHLSIKPNFTTDVSLVVRMEGLWSLIESVETRLAKFLCSYARDSMRTISDLIKNGTLERPAYWSATCAWIIEIQTKFPSDFDTMNRLQRQEMCIYAMATGDASTRVHYNFQTSANFLDFMFMSPEQAIALMNKRSDPRTNQISQVSQRRAQAGVVSYRNISLIWNTRDDLDLHVETEEGNIWFGNKTLYVGPKILGRLDFDAGIDGKGKGLVENISFTDLADNLGLRVKVNNFTCRSPGDVPFSVVITQGDEDTVYSQVWPAGRKKGDLFHVCTHVFAEPKDVKTQMSDKRANAAASQATEFKRLFGIPTSCVATLTDMSQAGVDVRVVQPDVTSEAAAACAEFEQLVSSARKLDRGEDKKKRYVSQSNISFDSLHERIMNGTVHTLVIHAPDHAPAYVTKIGVADGKALKSGKRTQLSSNCFQAKFRHPIKASQDLKIGTARLDGSWVASDDPHVHATAVVGGRPFLCLRGACLPQDPEGFPLSAGFYPQDLSDSGHPHRSRWTFVNTAMKPTIPDIRDGSALAIGTFLVNGKHHITVNGEKLVLIV